MKTNKQFGEKTIELLELMDTVSDWEKYVNDKTAEIISTVKETQSIQKTMDKYDMKYITVRSHILKAIERIKNRRTDFKRQGRSELAQELFELMEQPGWESMVTHYEAELAKKYREEKNFYTLGKKLNIAPSNIAGTLYGTTQKVGVIEKIKSGIPQTERRDYSVLPDNVNIEELR